MCVDIVQVTSVSAGASVMKSGDVTVIQKPGSIRIMVSPDWRGVVERNVPGARSNVVAHGPRWLRTLRRWW